MPEATIPQGMWDHGHSDQAAAADDMQRHKACKSVVCEDRVTIIESAPHLHVLQLLVLSEGHVQHLIEQYVQRLPIVVHCLHPTAGNAQHL